MPYQFYTADVFTDRPFSGNQLAVFPKAEGLNETIMQQIAAEFNFSETVFVFPPLNSKIDRQLRIFTPSGEIPFAGHPTIGTAFVLTKIASIPLQGEETEIIFQEGVGKVPVKVKARDNQPVYAELQAPSAPEFKHDTPNIADLAQILSLEVTELITEEYQPQAVSCGLPFLFIPLRNLEALGKARINQPAWESILSSFWASQVYPFCAVGKNKWRSRMFAPGLGIKEDPATGSAATAFAAYLANRESDLNGSWRWTIEQGIEMGRPSLLKASADKENGVIKEIRVGGTAVILTAGTMLVDG
jgi:trans-2,3-dihydro-3-hydroxyanthranilate isomerase